MDGDYQHFTEMVQRMNIAEFPAVVTIPLLERLNRGMYAQPLSEWSDQGLSGAKLIEYKDLKMCADAFEKIVCLVKGEKSEKGLQIE